LSGSNSRGSNFGKKVVETVLEEMALKYPKLTMREKMIICEAAELIARLFIEGMNKIAVEDNLEFASFSMMKHRLTKAIEEHGGEK
jgi:hypothetical protein